MLSLDSVLRVKGELAASMPIGQQGCGRDERRGGGGGGRGEVGAEKGEGRRRGEEEGGAKGNRQ